VANRIFMVASLPEVLLRIGHAPDEAPEGILRARV